MEEMMRTNAILNGIRGWAPLVAFVSAAVLSGCYEDEEPTPCEEYCDAAEECSFASHQMFSYSECQRECRESVERHGSVYCEDRYVDYLYCMTDLHCADWSDSGQYCAAQIDWLDSCVGGQS
jgi:hypothetical protein